MRALQWEPRALPEHSAGCGAERGAGRGAARGRRARLLQATRLPAPPPPFQACQYAFLISVARGLTPFMMMPAAFAGVSPPSPRCRLMQL